MLPKQLLNSYSQIQSCDLVANNSITPNSVKAFVDAINHAIPAPSNPMFYSIYRFNRSKYLADKQRFLADIKSFEPYDAMILWTDFKDILEHFSLTGKIFLGWNKSTSRYRGYVLSKPPPTASTEPAAPIRILRRGEKLSELEASVEAEADEMDRVYNYMQQRMAALQLN